LLQIHQHHRGLNAHYRGKSITPSPYIRHHRGHRDGVIVYGDGVVAIAMV
jgi:hypothetical protein